MKKLIKYSNGPEGKKDCHSVYYLEGVRISAKEAAKMIKKATSKEAKEHYPLPGNYQVSYTLI